MATQLQSAREGTITEQMRLIAGAEEVSAELVRDEAAAGRLVIPANKLHLETG